MRIHHLGLAVRDIAEAGDHYVDALGFHEASEVVEDPIQRVFVQFFATVPGQSFDSTTTLELVAPASDDSPILQTLARGVCGYHSCYEVESLDATIDRWSKAGAVVLGPPAPAVAFGGRRIAWLFLRTQHLVELLEKPSS